MLRTRQHNTRPARKPIRPPGARRVRGGNSAGLPTSLRRRPDPLDELRLTRLNSLRVAEKAAARPEGILKGRVVLNQRRHDAALYALVRGQ
jgi:hypothetical protein